MKKLIIILVFLGSFITAKAADISFDVPSNINVGQKFSIDIVLETGGVSINSIDIGVSYPKDLLVFKGYQESGGIIKLWLKHPEDKSGVIQMSGIIPGGVEGLYTPNKTTLGPLTLVRLLFVAKELGGGVLSIDHSTVLLNDGYGTELSHNKLNNSINITKDKGVGFEATVENSNTDDAEPPEPFDLSLVKSSYFSRTPSMLIFSAIDSVSGVKKYEMNDRGEWATVSSPLPMYRGFFSKQVTIRAVDYSGNIRESNIIIPGILSTISLVSIAILILVFAYTRFSWYKKKR
ncbi:MAG: hypothetical protein AAB477_01515 [Patescibacteria group bacterium]